MTIYIDERWIGEHGIGRFANVLANKINFTAMKMTGAPSSPLDAVRFFFPDAEFFKKRYCF